MPCCSLRRGRCWRLSWVSAMLVAMLGGCAPQVQQYGPVTVMPALTSDTFVTADGMRLPLWIWHAEGEERAVIVALHGFNDYRRTFRMAAPWWASRGITTYAYDQRGFGAAPRPGIWGGATAMAADARDFVAVVRARHPQAPVYLLGNSMGGAVAILVLGGDAPPAVDGAILVAPAVWGGQAMNPFFRFGLWLAAHVTPAKIVTGRGLKRTPSDNIDMLRELGRDPLIIKQTRVDTLYGLVGLMGAGYETAARIKAPLLILYGERDEIVPAAPVRAMARRLSAPNCLLVYPDGYHMLLRSLDAETAWRDIAAWISGPETPPPSTPQAQCANGVDNASSR